MPMHPSRRLNAPGAICNHHCHFWQMNDIWRVPTASNLEKRLHANMSTHVTLITSRTLPFGTNFNTMQCSHLISVFLLQTCTCTNTNSTQPNWTVCPHQHKPLSSLQHLHNIGSRPTNTLGWVIHNFPSTTKQNWKTNQSSACTQPYLATHSAPHSPSATTYRSTRTNETNHLWAVFSIICLSSAWFANVLYIFSVTIESTLPSFFVSFWKKNGRSTSHSPETKNKSMNYLLLAFASLSISRTRQTWPSISEFQK